MRDVRRLPADRWPDVAAVVLSLLVLAPLLRPGYVLSYDMVWVPQLELGRRDVWGLGSALPRAVPSDALVALAGTVLPQGVVQRLMLLGALVAAGTGASRLCRVLPLPGRLVAVTLAVWNPFVAERLALGSWPVLVAYAGTFWLLAGLLGARRVPAVLGLAATAISPATGVMGLLVVVACARGVAGRVRWLALGLALNAPWLVTGLLRGSDAVVDPLSVRLFDAQPELGLGRLGAVLSLGGIWNTEVVPVSRTLFSSAVLVVALWLLVLVGLWAWHRRGGDALLPLLGLGVVGVVVALAGSVAPDALGWVVAQVPGAGLLRDGTRWLLLLAPVQVVAAGHGAAWLVERCRTVGARRLATAGLVLVPVAALPDLAWGVGGQLEVAHYPQDWAEARDRVTQSGTEGDVLVLPFSSYRQPSWNHDRPVLDPLGRFLDRDTVVSDDLYVSGRRIAGEDPRAAEVGEVLDGDWTAKDLAELGIGVVVVDGSAPGAADLPFEQLASLRRLGGGDVKVYAVDGAARPGVPSSWRVLVPLAWVTALVGLVLALAGPALRRAGGGTPRAAGDAARS
ncbi:hypothetical protein [Aeromicrobium massiliense]|uniref:hypothetical protein n=1 Tax=Aeromicrobium massiliense TaxID=1464554 RepID=UPI0011CA7537|nr:hypothetical protein [Aeromicrobium massiliense]